MQRRIDSINFATRSVKQNNHTSQNVGVTLAAFTPVTAEQDATIQGCCSPFKFYYRSSMYRIVIYPLRLTMVIGFNNSIANVFTFQNKITSICSRQ
jgi:hypothetical protein